MLADRFAFTIRVSGEIDGVSFFGGLLQLGNDLLVVALFRIGNYFVGRFEIVFDVNAQAFRRQIFDMADRGHHQIVLSEIFIDRFRLGGRFNYY